MHNWKYFFTCGDETKIACKFGVGYLIFYIKVFVKKKIIFCVLKAPQMWGHFIISISYYSVINDSSISTKQKIVQGSKDDFST